MTKVRLERWDGFDTTRLMDEWNRLMCVPESDSSPDDDTDDAGSSECTEPTTVSGVFPAGRGVTGVDGGIGTIVSVSMLLVSEAMGTLSASNRAGLFPEAGKGAMDRLVGAGSVSGDPKMARPTTEAMRTKRPSAATAG